MGPVDANVRALLQDPQFASLIALRLDRTDTSWSFAQGVRRSILSVRRLIEEAQGLSRERD